MHTILIQVVTGLSLGEVLKNVIIHIRFPLLDKDVLSAIAAENEIKQYIPVSVNTNRYIRVNAFLDRSQ